MKEIYMKIKWLNVLLLVLVIVGIYLYVKVWPTLRDTSSHIEVPHEQVNPAFTLIVIVGMVLLTVITIIHIICNKR
jgi:Mn2+/Fe2+ NRAMP family transporter